VPNDMYLLKKMMSALGLKYGKIDIYLDNCMLFLKEHANEKKCLECQSCDLGLSAHPHCSTVYLQYKETLDVGLLPYRRGLNQDKL
jgi:hypothetical protein